jgi:TonB-linked SusC/RagA family outer membrane protein
MKKEYIVLFAMLFTFCGAVAQAQQTETLSTDSAKVGEATTNIIYEGLRNVDSRRNTGAVFTLSGKDLTRMTSGNLLNTLQGRIPGLTVVTGSGEPGYDGPTFYLRGQSSWNIAGNKVLIYLDGFEVNMNAISSLSPYEIESITLLKDASALAVYGLEGGAGVLSIKTYEGAVMPKTKITLNGRYGVQSAIDLPTLTNAYDYTRLYNQALTNDGLPTKYPNPDLYKATNDPFHPNVNWYNETLKNTSQIQDYNLSFRGGNPSAKYFVLMNYTDFKGIYKDADAVDKDFGTNAQYSKFNLRGNVELQLSKNLSVKANVTGITEDKDTPAGFTADELFRNLIRIPAAAFPVKNPNNSWGINSVYNFNPVQRLQQNGIYNAHTRNVQTSVRFTEKLDSFVPGLDLNGGLSFSNQYIGNYVKSFTVPAYEISKNAQDEPNLDTNGNPIYIVNGASSDGITEGEVSHWNRTTAQIGLNYNRTFDKQTFSGMLLAKRQSYTHNGLVYQIRTQGLAGNLTYDYDKKYIIDLSASYNGSADFGKGDRYGFFPAIGLGWVASDEDFLKNSAVIDFLKIRASYGSVGNINEERRFLNEQWGVGGDGWIVGTGNTTKNGRTEGRIANPNASWEKKTSFNIGVDATLFKNLSATIDVFSERRSGILEIASAAVPSYTGFDLPYLNNGVVDNKGFEASLNYNKKSTDFEYYVGASAAFARNKVVERSQDAQPYSYLYNAGYRLGQMRGLINSGFYQEADFDANGNLKAGIPSSSYANVKPGDLKYVDQDNNGIINDYDKKPIDYAKLPEITLGFNLGFKYKRFDFDAFLQSALNRTVSLLDDAYIYTHPFVDNNNITAFSTNSWTPATAQTATTPRLSTLSNPNNDQQSDFWLRNGSFLKLRSVELGYTLPQAGVLKKLDVVRVYINGTNLLSFDKIEDLEAERLSMGYPLMKAVSFGLRMKF